MDKGLLCVTSNMQNKSHNRNCKKAKDIYRVFIKELGAKHECVKFYFLLAVSPHKCQKFRFCKKYCRVVLILPPSLHTNPFVCEALEPTFVMGEGENMRRNAGPEREPQTENLFVNSKFLPILDLLSGKLDKLKKNESDFLSQTS